MKDLALIIFKVVGYFRRYIIFDQNDIEVQKHRLKPTIVVPLYQTTNCDT